MKSYSKKKRLHNESIEHLHDEIDKLQYGETRACSKCGKIFDTRVFPYSSKTQCLFCYEEISGKRLHAIRSRIPYEVFTDYKREYSVKETRIADTIDLEDFLESMGKMWAGRVLLMALKQAEILKKGRTVHIHPKLRLGNTQVWENKVLIEQCLKDLGYEGVEFHISEIQVEAKQDDFKRENSIEEIKSYLKKKEAKRLPVSIYYREKNVMDTFYNYYSDDTYLYVKNGNSRYYIKYLIDKIRKVV